MRLAYVENKKILARIQAPLQFFDLHIRVRALHRAFLSANAAKLVVVYQLRYRGMRAARRAIGVLAQLQLAELHAQRVYQQQSSNQRFANAED